MIILLLVNTDTKVGPKSLKEMLKPLSATTTLFCDTGKFHLGGGVGDLQVCVTNQFEINWKADEIFHGKRV